MGDLNPGLMVLLGNRLEVLRALLVPQDAAPAAR
jgi:hypothetical protein